MIPPIQSLFWRASNHSAELDQRNRPVATEAVSPSNRTVGIKSASRACTSISSLVQQLKTPSALKIGMTGFEPAAPSSRTKCATKLRYIPLVPS